jgi:hypothetical protein
VATFKIAIEILGFADRIIWFLIEEGEINGKSWTGRREYDDLLACLNNQYPCSLI